MAESVEIGESYVQVHRVGRVCRGEGAVHDPDYTRRYRSLVDRTCGRCKGSGYEKAFLKLDGIIQRLTELLLSHDG